MINLQIGIGVLGLPATLAQIGMVPGIILIILSGVITTWADTVIGLFKRGHPEVYSVADVGGIMAGRFGRELFGSMYWVSRSSSGRVAFSSRLTDDQLFCVLVGAGQVVAFSTAMNSITAHATCTIIWILVGSVAGIVIGMYRTLDKIGWMQWVGLVSLMGALITAAATAGVQDPPADISVRAFNNPGFLPGVQAGTNIILAFTGGPAFYNILSEMKQTKEFNKAVYWAQGFVTMTYLIIAAVIYGFVGSYVLGQSTILQTPADSQCRGQSRSWVSWSTHAARLLRYYPPGSRHWRRLVHPHPGQVWCVTLLTEITDDPTNVEQSLSGPYEIPDTSQKALGSTGLLGRE